ncbi:MAG: hypothetical protein H6835_10965 [Planctomycetes bacterium]|nr:hypothetical protein [Planctomycetota bacterium]
MQRETTPLARALVALSGLALCAAAAVTTLDPTVGLADPRPTGGHDDASAVVRDDWRVLPAVAGDDVVVAAAVEVVAAPHEQVDTGREDVVEPRREELVGVRALLVARSAAGLLSERFVEGLDTTLDGERTRRVDCSDRQAVSTMVGAGAGCALLAGALTPNQVRAGLRQQTLGAELFGLQVAATARPRSLGAEQVRRIFRGEVRDWRELGFAPGPIVPVVPADLAVASRAARALLGDVPFAVCCIRDDGAMPPGGVRLVRLADAAVTNDLRLLRIGDVVATPDAFFRGNYPFGLPLQLVTPGQPDARAHQLLAFARSDEGRALLGGALAFAD